MPVCIKLELHWPVIQWVSVYIATRTLDDPLAYSPDEHVFYGKRVGWLTVDDALPYHEGLSARFAHLQLATMTMVK